MAGTGFGAGLAEGIQNARANRIAQQQAQMQALTSMAALKNEGYDVSQTPGGMFGGGGMTVTQNGPTTADIARQKGALELQNLKTLSNEFNGQGGNSAAALTPSQAIPTQPTGGFNVDTGAPDTGVPQIQGIGAGKTFGTTPQFGGSQQFGATDNQYQPMIGPTGGIEFKENRAYITPEQKMQNERELETTAQQRITSLRGDKQLAESEAARESAKRGYNLIQSIKAQGRMPNPAELNTILGHAYTAQTGKDASADAIKGLQQQTFKEGIINQGIRKVTGQPMPAISKPILDNLEQLVTEGGLQADKEHEDYMKSRTGIKPTGIDEQAWKNISGAGRGQSFSNAVGIRSFNSEAEAEASGYKGNAIIAGKRARID